MHLTQLTIKNFRSINYLSIPFSSGKNVIVGKNNAGKSNIVKALNIVLGEKYPTYVDINEKDFFSLEDESDNFFGLYVV
jgi:putative ATP-dependent endonuclease of OLD family